MLQAKDVTRQYDAQRRIEEGERRYRELLEQSPVGIWENDWSVVKSRVDALERDGVTDLEVHLRERPELVESLLDDARVKDLNATNGGGGLLC